MVKNDELTVFNNVNKVIYFFCLLKLLKRNKLKFSDCKIKFIKFLLNNFFMILSLALFAKFFVHIGSKIQNFPPPEKIFYI